MNPFLSHRFTRWTIRGFLALLSILIILFGLYFLIFGAQLAWLGGSYYYIICGFFLTLSGSLMLGYRSIGGWLYLLTWFFTIPWTIYEVGFDLWGWLPRLFGPTLIASAVVIYLFYVYKIHKDVDHA